MIYDFDQITDRRHTYSVKYDTAAFGKPDDVLPLWVADMDFQSPPCVLDAIERQCRHGIFGYFDTGDAYFEVLRSWFSRRFGWDVERDWLVKVPGVVNAVHVALLALTDPGDSVIVQQPVYSPLSAAVQKTGRRLVVNHLSCENRHYQINFDDFEQKIMENQAKAFLLCNPHNPVGRVWTREELVRMGDICVRHGVIIISDEIHQDFTYGERKHLVLAGLDPKYRDITVTCTAPTKTFNLASLPLSNIFIPNAEMRERFVRERSRSGDSQIGVMGVVACQAAYESGEPWLEELLCYLEGNIALTERFLKKTEITLFKPEGTYLAWLDFRALGLSDAELEEFLTQKARLWLNSGTVFGAGGAGFQRINLACPQPVLREALERLEKALRG